MRKIVPLLAPLALGLPAIPAARAEVPTPSFACSAARTEVERTVCTTPELAREDAVMARLYAAARRGARDDGQSGQGAAQLAWLRERAGCEKFNSSAYTSRAECLGGQYRTRNIALATAALFTDREFALEQLRRLDPKDAPLVTALVIHASHPPGSNWTSPALAADRARIAALFKTPHAELGSDPMQGYGRAILNDSAASLDDAFKSDRAFADTLAILAVYAQGEQTPILIPCAALVRNPALIAVTEPRFGSSLDNFVPRSDCETALAPAPALAALSDRISRTWPDCEGTIRFASYRDFAVRLDEARLGHPPVKVSASKPLRRLRAVAPGQIATAEAELSSRYLAWGVPLRQAAATARARIAALLNSAHHCGG